MKIMSDSAFIIQLFLIMLSLNWTYLFSGYFFDQRLISLVLLVQANLDMYKLKFEHYPRRFDILFLIFTRLFIVMTRMNKTKYNLVHLFNAISSY